MGWDIHGPSPCDSCAEIHGIGWPDDLLAVSLLPMQEFPLGGEYIELHKLLKLLGAVESGGAAKALVAEGRVRVDGQVELRKGCKIRVGQTVEYPGGRVRVAG